MSPLQLLITSVLIAFLFGSGRTQDASFISYVDLFTSTAGDHGQLDPAACVPFGMVKLGPDTEPDNHSGYDYNATKIKGFSHNRISGVGCSGAGGNIRIKPGIGVPHAKSLVYDKKSEFAQPGYYRVDLPEIRTSCELTANNYTGFHRYQFPASNQAFFYIDLQSSFAKFKSANYHFESDREIVGKVKAQNVCDEGIYIQYFSIFFPSHIPAFKETKEGIYALFSTEENNRVEIQVSLSPISTEQAIKDRINRVGTKSFEQIRKEAAQAWEETLSRVEVQGLEDYKKLFYTHLYRSCLLPVNSTSTDGQFRGTNGKLYTAADYIHYDGWSIWDTYRTKLPLLTLLYPERMSDMTKSLVDLYRHGKYAWAGKHEPVPTVRTEHALLVLLDAYQKGIQNFDPETAYQGMLEEANKLPYKSPDNILETSYDYWGIAQFARILNKKEDYRNFAKRAVQYKKIWKEKFLVMNERSDIMHGDGLYEGTLWQYRWSVPWDVAGMIRMMGGKKEFVRQLEYFFEQDLYNHGNQPDIQAPFLFNLGNRPDLTQKWVNRILTKPMPQHYGTHKKWEVPYHSKIYKTSPDGYIPEMDDDAGTMSAWFVWASMGLYPLCVGSSNYQLSTPIFDHIIIHLPEGKKFEIRNKGFSDSSYYIKSAKLNGKNLGKSELDHAQIARGGKLDLVISK